MNFIYLEDTLNCRISIRYCRINTRFIYLSTHYDKKVMVFEYSLLIIVEIIIAPSILAVCNNFRYIIWIFEIRVMPKLLWTNVFSVFLFYYSIWIFRLECCKLQNWKFINNDNARVICVRLECNLTPQMCKRLQICLIWFNKAVEQIRIYVFVVCIEN